MAVDGVECRNLSGALSAGLKVQLRIPAFVPNSFCVGAPSYTPYLNVLLFEWLRIHKA